MTFIYGGDTGTSYDELMRKRKIAESLRQSNQTTPKNTGEGIHAIARAMVQRNLEKKNAQALEQNPQLAAMVNMQGMQDVAGKNPSPEVIEALMGGAPNYARGGVHGGGQAVVGENGPEVVDLPPGAVITPGYLADMERLRAMGIEPLPPAKAGEERNYFVPGQEEYDPASQERLQAPGADTAPAPIDPRSLIDQESRFDDANAYQTADMSGVAPSGVGETNQLNALARSFQGLMQSMQDYEGMYKDGGSTMWPGERKDKLDTAHRDLQMQMKELYNLGVLNGPDLELMNQILLIPTSVSGNVMDAMGIADMDKRITSNIDEVRRMMINRTTPALQQLGIDPESLMPAEKKEAEAPAAPDGDGWIEVNGVRIREKK